MKEKRVKGSPSSKQNVTVELEDRLSGLPEEIRNHIVSLLPLQDAIRTSILSKKWRYTCSSLSNLIFLYDHFPDVERKLDRFVEFIDQTLSRHDELAIETFMVKFWVPVEPKSHIKNEWITFAVLHNVQKLILVLQINRLERLPCCLFTSKSLTTLKLVVLNNVLRLPTAISLPNLKELILAAFIFADVNLMQKLLSSCPVLETLAINQCNLSHLKVLVIAALKLKYLIIYKCEGISECEINLQTPSLKRFVFDGNVAREFNLGNTSSISEVSIHFQKPLPRGRSKVDLNRHTVKVLKGFCNMALLSVNGWFIEYLFFKVCDPWISLNTTYIHNLKSILLYVWPITEHIQKIIILLSRIPKLRMLYIVISALESHVFISVVEANLQNLALVGMLNHLEYIGIKNFGGSESELEIVKFLLDNAKVLVKMKIMAPKGSDQAGPEKPMKISDEKRMKINAKILAFSRASSRATILFL